MFKSQMFVEIKNCSESAIKCARLEFWVDEEDERKRSWKRSCCTGLNRAGLGWWRQTWHDMTGREGRLRHHPFDITLETTCTCIWIQRTVCNVQHWVPAENCQDRSKNATMIQIYLKVLRASLRETRREIWCDMIWYDTVSAVHWAQIHFCDDVHRCRDNTTVWSCAINKIQRVCL